MKRILSILAVVAIALPLAAVAACPNAGTYSTGAGTVIEGRASDGWCTGVAWTNGDISALRSWDGAALGTEWSFVGATQTSVALDNDLYDAGSQTGVIVAHLTYTGGNFWLSGDGPWSSDGDLTGTLNDANGTVHIEVVNGVTLAVHSTFLMSGVVDDCDGCELSFTITQQERVWAYEDGGPAAPADYPAFECGDIGALWNVTEVAFHFDCTVATEIQSWSQIKSLYR